MNGKEADYISKEVKDCWLVRAYIERSERERHLRDGHPVSRVRGRKLLFLVVNYRWECNVSLAYMIELHMLFVAGTG
jgi:hypothetical protein